MDCFPIQCMPGSSVLSTWGHLLKRGKYTRGLSSKDVGEALWTSVSQTNSTFKRTQCNRGQGCVLYIYIRKKKTQECKITGIDRYMGKQPTLFSFFPFFSIFFLCFCGVFFFLVRSFGIAVSLFLKLVCY